MKIINEANIPVQLYSWHASNDFLLPADKLLISSLIRIQNVT